MRVLIFALATGFALAPASPGQKNDEETRFESRVRPILAARCGACHGAKVRSGGLSLISKQGFTQGGNSGVPAATAIGKAIRGEKPFQKMPLGGSLSPDESNELKQWLAGGAKWPEDPTASTGGQSSDELWSLRPVVKPDVPAVQDAAWPRSDIDRFILSKLEEKRLKPAGDADRRTLLRRVYFDLTGLPPTPQEVAAFVADRRSNAFEAVVDRLLASPRYGERWGRHWLDIARYADTSGDNADFPIPQAYLYRDWVISAINRDLPYNDFLRYQVAGDILARDEHDASRYRDKVTATGFLAMAHRFGNNKKDEVYLTIEDTIDTLGRGVLGLTLRCARCHDHKFDPLTVNDYYGLYGIFASTKYPWAGASDSTFPNDLQPLSVEPKVREAASRRFDQLADYMRQINDNKYVTKPTRDRYAELNKTIAASEKAGQDASAAIRERDELLEKNAKFREFLVNGIEWLRAARARLAKEAMPCDFAYAVSEGEPKDVPVQLGGDPARPGRVVPRQFVTVAMKGQPNPTLTGSGRLELGNWLASDQNALTRRVFVNRVWQWHFGTGIVATSDNFGRRGTPPVNPALLDYLAAVFAEDGWSLKSLQRRIVLSRAYQLSSEFNSANAEVDPAASYLWRFPPRRLEAEAIRDAMLAVSGDLDLNAGGPQPLEVWPVKKYNLNSPFHEQFDHNRRSVYLLTQRLFENPFLGLFDGPDTNQTTSSRDRSNLVTQALYLLNSPFVGARAESFARRIRQSAGDNAGRISFAFETALSRQPTEAEVRGAEAFLQRYRDASPTGPDGEAWVALARSLLVSNEFFFLN